jgi:hypothetical protein
MRGFKTHRHNAGLHGVRFTTRLAGSLLWLGCITMGGAALADDAPSDPTSTVPADYVNAYQAAPPASAPSAPLPGAPVPLLSTSYAADPSACSPDPCAKPPLCGLIAASDASFGNFISPISNPVFFEDPRTLTEAKFIFLNHRLPSSVGGNDVQLYALQLRAAITDRLSIIATKDGCIVSENSVEGDGWANLAAGLKYNLYKDAAAQQILSVGATFQLPTGTPAALQGNGDGEFNLFATGGMQIRPMLALDHRERLSAAGRSQRPDDELVLGRTTSTAD